MTASAFALVAMRGDPDASPNVSRRSAVRPAPEQRRWDALLRGERFVHIADIWRR